MLCVMVRCLHGGHSFIASMTPTFTLNAHIMKTKASLVIFEVHKYGGHVLAIVCDGLRTNITFFGLFDGYDINKPWVVPHPCCQEKSLYLLTDTVHILKCIRNNWYTEKLQRICLGDMEDFAEWKYLIQLYESEKDSLFKMAPLTKSAVQPSPIERQKVLLALKIIDDRTIAALKALKSDEVNSTITTLEILSEWWKLINVKSIIKCNRFNDPSRSAVTSADCYSLCRLSYLADFLNNGNNRIACLTVDTKRALTGTSYGLVELSKDLLQNFGFDYVLLGELQQDKLEGEFGCWRQMCRGNMYMSVKDVNSSYRKRGLLLLAKLEALQTSTSSTAAADTCPSCSHAPDADTLAVLDNLTNKLQTLTNSQIHSSAYIAGYVIKCNPEMEYDASDLVDDHEFVDLVSRGSLVIPDKQTTFWVQLCLLFSDSIKLTCHKQLSESVLQIASSYGISPVPPKSACRQLANVLLSGFQKRDIDITKKKQSIKLKRVAASYD